MDLRPLGFGEIFDRAITLYIANFVPFVGIVMVMVVPLAVMQYFIDLASQPQFDAMIRLFEHPETARSQPMPTMFDSPVSVVMVILTLLVATVLWPFALNAVAVGVARLYRGRPVEFRACYEAVTRRWTQVLGMLGMQILVMLAWYLVVLIVVIGIVVTVALLGALSPVAAFWLGFGGALLGFAVALPALAPLFIALTFAMYSVVIEDLGVMASLRLGFARVFNRGEFWRAMLFAIAAAAVVLGGSAVFAMLGLLAAFAHLPSVQAVIESLTRAVVTPFGVVLLAIYYFDVRIRREAFDLEASLEHLTAAYAT
ncbi:MAG TPA: hypothetical protein VGX91_04795 [Candidatus Cybelea sp.]|jgi:hypothetical protein|nr:hypothetical protein [Candidatus Cybelea sp.]